METTLREPRPEKVAVVDEVRARLGAAAAAILTEYRGLRVADIERLRQALAAAGGEYKIYKNTLVRRAVAERQIEGLDPLLEGPTAVAFVRDDAAAVAKVLRDFARTHPALVVKGGLLGDNLLDARATAALADLPSREVLLAQFAGLLAAPMQRFAALLQAVPQKLAYGLQALIDQRRAGGEDAVAGEAAAETVGGEAAAPSLPEADAPAGGAVADVAPGAAEGGDGAPTGGDAGE